MALPSGSSLWALLCSQPLGPEGQELRPLGLLKGLFSFSRSISKGRCLLPQNQQYPLNNKSIQSSQKAIKLSTGHESGALK